MQCKFGFVVFGVIAVFGVVLIPPTHVAAQAGVSSSEPSFRINDGVFERGEEAELSIAGFDACAGAEVQLGFYEGGFAIFTRTVVDASGNAQATLVMDRPGIFYPAVGGPCAAEIAGHQFECDCYLFLHNITVTDPGATPGPPSTGTGIVGRDRANVSWTAAVVIVGLVLVIAGSLGTRSGRGGASKP